MCLGEKDAPLRVLTHEPHPQIRSMSSRKWKDRIRLKAALPHWKCRRSIQEEEQQSPTTSKTHFSDRVPTNAILQSQSFSRGYGSNLPTSLICVVPSTRGWSPWRPDAVMSTNGRENQSFPRIFKGLQERTGHHKKCGALPTIKPYLLAIRFHGVRSLTRKENSSQGSCRRLRVQLRYRKSSPKGLEYPRSGSGILTRFPFDKWPKIGPLKRSFPIS